MLVSKIDIRVEWGHCDPAQIVYNPNFYDWMEHGLVALFDAAGLDIAAMMDSDPNFRGTPLVGGEARFLAPARVGDVLTLSSRVTSLGRASFGLAHEFHGGGTLVCEASQTRVWGVGGDGHVLKTRPVPDAARRALSAEGAVHRRLVSS